MSDILPPPPPDQLLALSRRLEAQVLSNMLGAAGLHETSGAWQGGAGEMQFASFLRDAQATEIVKAGGLGLAAQIQVALLAARIPP
jgi:hypothetical protein